MCRRVMAVATLSLLVAQGSRAEANGRVRATAHAANGIPRERSLAMVPGEAVRKAPHRLTHGIDKGLRVYREFESTVTGERLESLSDFPKGTQAAYNSLVRRGERRLGAHVLSDQAKPVTETDSYSQRDMFRRKVSTIESALGAQGSPDVATALREFSEIDKGGSFWRGRQRWTLAEMDATSGLAKKLETLKVQPQDLLSIVTAPMAPEARQAVIRSADRFRMTDMREWSGLVLEHLKEVATGICDTLIQARRADGRNRETHLAEAKRSYEQLEALAADLSDPSLARSVAVSMQLQDYQSFGGVRNSLRAVMGRLTGNDSSSMSSDLIWLKRDIAMVRP